MAKTYGTCGHELVANQYASLALGIMRYDFDSDCMVPMIDYVTYCETCATGARAESLVLETVQEQHDWLATPLC